MKYFSVMAAFTFIACIQGCSASHPMDISAIASPGQQVGYRETITSQKINFVSVAPYKGQTFNRSKAQFILCVKNCSDQSIEINRHDVTANFLECTGNSDIQITWASGQTYPQSLDFPKNEAAEESNRRTKPFHYAALIGNSTYCTWRSDLPEKSLFRTIVNQYLPQRQKKAAEEFYFQPRVLQPGEGESGLIVCDTSVINSKVEGNFRLVVSVNGERHEFAFNRGIAE